jgi:hypothetical protein
MHVKGTLAQVVELNSSSGLTESGDRTKWSRESATYGNVAIKHY